MENLVGGIILLFITVYAIKFGFAFLGTITLIVIRLPFVLIGKNYRVLSTYEDAKMEIGQYIKENRADLAEEVESVIHELRPF